MKKLYLKAPIILFFLLSVTNLYAGGGGHGIFPFCKDMHIEASEPWYPGKTIYYSINYSEHKGEATQHWDITGGTIVSVNDRILNPDANVYAFNYQSNNYIVTSYDTESDPDVDFEDPTNIIGTVSPNIFAIVGKIVGDILKPKTPEDPYVRIGVRWDQFASTASIHCYSRNMGVGGICGNGEERLDYNVDCVDNSNPLVLINDQTIVPTCQNNGAFQFFIPDNVKNTNITWTLPPNWIITGAGTNTVSGKNLYTISGRVNFGGDPTKLAGLASVALTRPCDGGVSRITENFPGESYFARNITPLSLVICPYKEVTVPVTINASEGVGPYTYAWSKPNASCSINGGTGCTAMSYTTTEIMNENISVKITDAKGCYAVVPIPYTKLDPNASWGAYQLFTNFATEKPVIDENYTYFTDIITDQTGNPYYVSTGSAYNTGGNLYTYQFITTPYIGWKNSALISETKASGQLAIYEPTLGNKTIYYGATDGKIYFTNTTSNVWSLPIPVTGPQAATGDFKLNSNGILFYINSSNQLYSKINNYSSPIVNAVFPGTEMALTNKYLYYVNTNQQVAAIDYTTSPYTNITFNTTPQSQVLDAINLSDFVYSKYSDLELDVAGNAYFVGSDNALYQANASTGVLTKVSSSKKYNGYLGTGKQAGVVYAATTDYNIYQFIAANGDTPAEISFMNGNLSQPIGPNSYWFRQAGAIHFRDPNVFYVSEDGTIKAVLYNTNGICTPPTLREASDSEESSNSAASTVESTSHVLNAFPNPFSSTTNFNYTLNTSGEVKVLLYNSTGELVSTVASEQDQAGGNYTVAYSNSNLRPGLYICQLLLNGQKLDQVKVVVN
ncbi:MAG: hypothetical protein JWO58_2536 [Chitinophagaceae bacterium]|nr:hypothetical protein [Chitinophagaceae bacterium]